MFEQPREVKSAPYALPGVLWITAGELAQRFREIPHDAIIVLSLLPVTHSCGKGAVRASEAGDAPSQRRMLACPSRDFAYLLPRPPGGHQQTDRTPFFNQHMTARSRRQR